MFTQVLLIASVFFTSFYSCVRLKDTEFDSEDFEDYKDIEDDFDYNLRTDDVLSACESPGQAGCCKVCDGNPGQVERRTRDVGNRKIESSEPHCNSVDKPVCCYSACNAKYSRCEKDGKVTCCITCADAVKQKFRRLISEGTPQLGEEINWRTGSFSTDNTESSEPLCNNKEGKVIEPSPKCCFDKCKAKYPRCETDKEAHCCITCTEAVNPKFRWARSEGTPKLEGNLYKRTITFNLKNIVSSKPRCNSEDNPVCCYATCSSEYSRCKKDQKVSCCITCAEAEKPKLRRTISEGTPRLGEEINWRTRSFSAEKTESSEPLCNREKGKEVDPQPKCCFDNCKAKYRRCETDKEAHCCRTCAEAVEKVEEKYRWTISKGAPKLEEKFNRTVTFNLKNIVSSKPHCNLDDNPVCCYDTCNAEYSRCKKDQKVSCCINCAQAEKQTFRRTISEGTPRLEEEINWRTRSFSAEKTESSEPLCNREKGKEVDPQPKCCFDNCKAKYRKCETGEETHCCITCAEAVKLKFRRTRSEDTPKLEENLYKRTMTSNLKNIVSSKPRCTAEDAAPVCCYDVCNSRYHRCLEADNPECCKTCADAEKQERNRAKSEGTSLLGVEMHRTRSSTKATKQPELLCNTKDEPKPMCCYDECKAKYRKCTKEDDVFCCKTCADAIKEGTFQFGEEIINRRTMSSFTTYIESTKPRCYEGEKLKEMCCYDVCNSKYRRCMANEAVSCCITCADAAKQKFRRTMSEGTPQLGEEIKWRARSFSAEKTESSEPLCNTEKKINPAPMCCFDKCKAKYPRCQTDKEAHCCITCAEAVKLKFRRTLSEGTLKLEEKLNRTIDRSEKKIESWKPLCKSEEPDLKCCYDVCHSKYHICLKDDKPECCKTCADTEKQERNRAISEGTPELGVEIHRRTRSFPKKATKQPELLCNTEDVPKPTCCFDKCDAKYRKCTEKDEVSCCKTCADAIKEGISQLGGYVIRNARSFSTKQTKHPDLLCNTNELPSITCCYDECKAKYRKCKTNEAVSCCITCADAVKQKFRRLISEGTPQLGEEINWRTGSFSTDNTESSELLCNTKEKEKPVEKCCFDNCKAKYRKCTSPEEADCCITCAEAVNKQFRRTISEGSPKTKEKFSRRKIEFPIKNIESWKPLCKSEEPNPKCCYDVCHSRYHRCLEDDKPECCKTCADTEKQERKRMNSEGTPQLGVEIHRRTRSFSTKATKQPELLCNTEDVPKPTCCFDKCDAKYRKCTEKEDVSCCKTCADAIKEGIPQLGGYINRSARSFSTKETKHPELLCNTNELPSIMCCYDECKAKYRKCTEDEDVFCCKTCADAIKEGIFQLGEEIISDRTMSSLVTYIESTKPRCYEGEKLEEMCCYDVCNSKYRRCKANEDVSCCITCTDAAKQKFRSTMSEGTPQLGEEIKWRARSFSAEKTESSEPLCNLEEGKEVEPDPMCCFDNCKAKYRRCETDEEAHCCITCAEAVKPKFRGTRSEGTPKLEEKFNRTIAFSEKKIASWKPLCKSEEPEPKCCYDECKAIYPRCRTEDEAHCCITWAEGAKKTFGRTIIEGSPKLEEEIIIRVSSPITHIESSKPRCNPGEEPKEMCYYDVCKSKYRRCLVDDKPACCKPCEESVQPSFRRTDVSFSRSEVAPKWEEGINWWMRYLVVISDESSKPLCNLEEEPDPECCYKNCKSKYRRCLKEDAPECCKACEESVQPIFTRTRSKGTSKSEQEIDRTRRLVTIADESSKPICNSGEEPKPECCYEHCKSKYRRCQADDKPGCCQPCEEPVKQIFTRRRCVGKPLVESSEPLCNELDNPSCCYDLCHATLPRCKTSMDTVCCKVCGTSEEQFSSMAGDVTRPPIDSLQPHCNSNEEPECCFDTCSFDGYEFDICNSLSSQIHESIVFVILFLLLHTILS